MRQICYSVASSLDGYIAGPKGEYDWIVHDPDIDFDAMLGRFDTLLMGRKSYEVAVATGWTDRPGVQLVVVSRTLAASPPAGLTVIGDDVELRVRELKARAGKDIWLWGGGELFRALLAAGLVDRVEVGLIPALVGGGIPFLPSPAVRTRLALRAHRLYPKSGVFLIEYDVKPSPA